MELIPRYRVSWRKVGIGSRCHAVRIIERGRLSWQTLCGRPTAGSRLAATGMPECGKCAEQLEPLRPSERISA